MRKYFLLLFLLVFFCAALARATVFGNVRGVVHDPQHFPVANSSVQINSASSACSLSTTTDSNGECSFPAVPFGDYTVTAHATGFSPLQQSLTLASDTSSVLHFMLS